MTLTWDPVREGAILDDVQISHDGARGILVLPISGEAVKAVNKDNKAIVIDNSSAAATNVMASIPTISAREVEAAPVQQHRHQT